MRDIHGHNREAKMHNGSFNSEEITLLTAVLNRVCSDQHVVDDGERLDIGIRLIHKAQTGERRFQALADYATRGGLIPQLYNASSVPPFPPYRFSVIDPAADELA
jgi:hypothetical protein